MLGCSREGHGVALDLMRTQSAGHRPAGGSSIATYMSYVDGQDIDSGRYLYTVTTAALLDDVFAALNLKRGLESGTLDLGAATEDVVGRCAMASQETVVAAVDSAAAAAPVWAAVPLADRMRLGSLIRERLRRGHAELVDVLVAEGSPRALAQ